MVKRYVTTVAFFADDQQAADRLAERIRDLFHASTGVDVALPLLCGAEPKQLTEDDVRRIAREEIDAWLRKVHNRTAS